jgi:hypothetical protein
MAAVDAVVAMMEAMVEADVVEMAEVVTRMAEMAEVEKMAAEEVGAAYGGGGRSGGGGADRGGCDQRWRRCGCKGKMEELTCVNREATTTAG